jgi:hypothetical protein
MLREVAREVVPVAVSGTVEGLADPNTQRTMVAAVDEGNVQTVSARLSAGFVDGVLNTLEDPVRRKRLEAILNGLTARAAGVAVDSMFAHAFKALDNPERQQRLQQMVADLSAAAAGAVVEAMLTAVFDGLGDPARHERLEAILVSLTGKVSGAMVESILTSALDEHVQTRMRLAMSETMTELITVMFEAVVSNVGSPEKQIEAFGAAAHEISKQATLGIQEALDQTRRDRESGKIPEQDGALVIAAGEAAQIGDRILWTLVGGLVAVLLALGLTLIWANRRNRLRRAELEQRDDALLLLTEAIKSNEALPGAADFHAALEKSMGSRVGAEHLQRLLGEKGRHLGGIGKSI